MNILDIKVEDVKEEADKITTYIYDFLKKNTDRIILIKIVEQNGGYFSFRGNLEKCIADVESNFSNRKDISTTIINIIKSTSKD